MRWLRQRDAESVRGQSADTPHTTDAIRPSNRCDPFAFRCI